jgi:hypothetical protein
MLAHRRLPVFPRHPLLPHIYIDDENSTTLTLPGGQNLSTDTSDHEVGARGRMV